MDCSTPGFLVLHCLPEFAQIHVHWVNDAIQPSQPLLSPSPPALNLSHHQGLFQWVSSIRGPKYWSFSFSISSSNEYSWFISFKIDQFNFLADQRTHSQESFPALHFKSINSSVLSLLNGQTLTFMHDYCINHSFDYMDFCRQSDFSVF